MKIQFNILVLFLIYISKRHGVSIRQSIKQQDLLILNCESLNQICFYDIEKHEITYVTDSWQAYIKALIDDCERHYPLFSRDYLNDKDSITFKTHTTSA